MQIKKQEFNCLVGLQIADNIKPVEQIGHNQNFFNSLQPIFLIQDKNCNKSIRQERSKQKVKQRTRIKVQTWLHNEIKKIFKLYNQYGSQWKIMETQFKDRSANSIKNRFYTVIRTMLKLLFKWHSHLNQKLPHQIASKTILKFYEGRQEFSKFKGFGKKILKQIDYNLESKQIKQIAQENSQQIESIYSIIFKPKNEVDQQSSSQKKQQKKARQQTGQNNEQNCSWGRKHSGNRQQAPKSQTACLQSQYMIPQYDNQNQQQCVFFFVPVPIANFYELQNTNTYQFQNLNNNNTFF